MSYRPTAAECPVCHRTIRIDYPPGSGSPKLEAHGSPTESFHACQRLCIGSNRPVRLSPALSHAAHSTASANKSDGELHFGVHQRAQLKQFSTFSEASNVGN